MATWNENLKAARLRAGLKQADVAEKIGYASTALTTWEKGVIKPSYEVLERLCEIYSISPLSLLDKTYEYDDLLTIAGKSARDRSYEESIVLNFSFSIISNLIPVDKQKKENSRIEEMAKFLKDTNLVNRFKGQLTQAQIETIKAEYDKNEAVVSDILFAFNSLTEQAKTAFVDVLCGFLHDDDATKVFSGEMSFACVYTIDRLEVWRDSIRKR